MDGIEVRSTEGDTRSKRAVVTTRAVACGERVFLETPVAFVSCLTATLLDDTLPAHADGQHPTVVCGYDAVANGSGTIGPLHTLAAVAFKKSIKADNASWREPAWKMTDPLFRHELTRILNIKDSDCDALDEQSLKYASSLVCGSSQRVVTPFSRMTMGYALYTQVLCHVNHACDANCTVIYGPDGAAHVVALRTLPADTEVCISVLPPDMDMTLIARLALINERSIRECTCAACVVSLEPTVSIDTNDMEAFFPREISVAVNMACAQVPELLLNNRIRTAARLAQAAVEKLRNAGFSLYSKDNCDRVAEQFTLAAGRVSRLYFQTKIESDTASGLGNDTAWALQALEAYSALLDTQMGDYLLSLERFEANFMRAVMSKAPSAENKAVELRRSLCLFDSAMRPWLFEKRVATNAVEN